MTDIHEHLTSAAVKVARDLTAIEELAALIPGQAVHKANATIDGTGLPGGLSMVTLAAVASPEAWENVYEAREAFGRSADHVIDEDDEWEPPLQTLLFWSEGWRREHDADYGRRPTIATEANFIRYLLGWAWENEPHWDDFARDINRARVRLEEVLYAGNRVERTRVNCIEVDCERKSRLIKVYKHTEAEDHYKCPGCKVLYSPQRYRMAKAELLASQDANRHVPMQDALAAIDRSGRTFRKWLRYWYVRSYRDPLTGTVMVWWPDVRETDLDTPKRNRAVA